MGHLVSTLSTPLDAYDSLQLLTLSALCVAAYSLLVQPEDTIYRTVEHLV